MEAAKKNNFIAVALVLFVNICLAATINAQQPNKNPDNYKPRRDITTEQQQENAIAQRQRALRNLENNKRAEERIFERMPPRMSPEEAERRREEIENYSKILNMLRPPNSYYIKYADLLKDEKWNLARLFVDKNCGEGKIVAVKELERCANVAPVKGGGSLYSFRLRKNAYFTPDWWDIHFTGDKFTVGNETVQTIISDVGAVDLKDVHLKSKAFEFLKDYEPKLTLAELKEQNKILEKGITFGGFTYSNSVAVNPDSTYVLRSTAYRLKIQTLLMNVGKGIDTFVAFRIVGREQDGSLVILWKELKTELPRRELK
jgi:hypothetical protein